MCRLYYGVLGGRCNHDWGMTERGEQNKLTRHDEHLPERRNECGSGSHKGSRKNTTRRCGDFFQAACFTLGAMFFWVQEFRQRLSIASASWALHSPCTKFVNKVAEWRRPLYLFGLNLRGQDNQLLFPLKLKIPHIPILGIWGNMGKCQFYNWLIIDHID